MLRCPKQITARCKRLQRWRNARVSLCLGKILMVRTCRQNVVNEDASRTSSTRFFFFVSVFVICVVVIIVSSLLCCKNNNNNNE